MVSGNSSGSANSDSSFSTWIDKAKNCQGCQERKENLQKMLTSGNFWVGVVIGVGGVWAYHKYVKK